MAPHTVPTSPNSTPLSEFSLNKNDCLAATRLPLLADIMPATRSSQRLGQEPTVEAPSDRNTSIPKTKKLRIRSPVPSPTVALRGRNRNPLGSVSSSALNKPKPASFLTAQKTTGMNDEAAVVITARKNKRSRSRSKERECLNSAYRPSVTPTPEPRKASPPQVGDRFRVFYDNADDCFGKAREGGKGYFFGTVASTSRPRKDKDRSTIFNIKIKFENGDVSEVLEYPAADGGVEKVIESCDGPNQLMGENGQFACDLCPAKLDVGDLVFCRFRNEDRRFRGRIAGISENQKRFDIAYDDGDLEKDVPLHQIWLVEDGKVFRHWIDGLSVQFPIGSSNRKALCTIKVLPEEDSLELVHSNGKVEKQSYNRVVHEIFAELKRQNCTKTYVWPNLICKEGKYSMAVDQPQKAKKLSNKSKNSSRANGPVNDDHIQCSPKDFASDPWASDESDDEDRDEKTPPLKDMSNSVRNSFWKALNSSESHFGADLLFKLTNGHKKVPNDELCRDLISLLWKGPLHRNNQFPDCVRTELANNYFELVRTKGMGPRFAQALPGSFTKQFLEQVEMPAVLYCVDGDESRVTSAALKRVGQTLNVKNSGASMFCYLLQSQLKGGYHRFGKNADPTRRKSKLNLKREMDEFTKQLRSRDLTRDILDTLGSTQALKLAVRASFSVLIHYGHYLSNDFVFPPASTVQTGCIDPIPPHATPNDRAYVATEVRRLLESMGQIVAYLAWIYSIEQGEGIYESRFLIRDGVDGLLASSTFNPSVFLSSKSNASQHWMDMKLRFALTLDKRISGLLGKHTADLFKLTVKYFD